MEIKKIISDDAIDLFETIIPSALKRLSGEYEQLSAEQQILVDKWLQFKRNEFKEDLEGEYNINWIILNTTKKERMIQLLGQITLAANVGVFFDVQLDELYSIIKDL